MAHPVSPPLESQLSLLGGGSYCPAGGLLLRTNSHHLPAEEVTDMNYIVAQREMLSTRYLVTDVDDEDDAADCVRLGLR